MYQSRDLPNSGADHSASCAKHPSHPRFFAKHQTFRANQPNFEATPQKFGALVPEFRSNAQTSPGTLPASRSTPQTCGALLWRSRGHVRGLRRWRSYPPFASVRAIGQTGLQQACIKLKSTNINKELMHIPTLRGGTISPLCVGEAIFLLHYCNDACLL